MPPLQLSQCGGKIAVRFLVEIRDPDIADAAFFHASVDALDLDFASCQRHFAGGSIGRLQSHCHLRPIFAAKLFTTSFRLSPVTSFPSMERMMSPALMPAL